MQKLLLIAIAGGLGTLSRYALSGLVHKIVQTNFPLGTMVVNILGCFLFGIVWGLSENSLLVSPASRAIVLTGFMGAFTTFSTFMFESNALLESGQYLSLLANIALQNILGLAFVFLALTLTRTLYGA